MNWRAIRAIVRKDLAVVRRSRALMIPLSAVPIIMLVVLPLVLSLLPNFLMGSAEGRAKLAEMIAALPPVWRRSFEGYTPAQTWIVFVNLNLAGERERKTLEALLYTPTTDGELFVAKLLAAWVPALAVGFVGFVLYAVVLNAAAWPIMGRVFFPNATWLVLAGWVAPAFAGLGLAGMVLVSLRVGGTQEAIQLGGLLVLPIIALIVGQVRGAVLLGPALVFAVGLGVWLIDAVLLWYGVRSFRRTKLIARL
jgi:ABC-type Na+ efflux pump permease subunit